MRTVACAEYDLARNEPTSEWTEHAGLDMRKLLEVLVVDNRDLHRCGGVMCALHVSPKRPATRTVGAAHSGTDKKHLLL